MFQAILNSKVRNNFGNGGADSDWRSRYRQTEDFLTAAVFCRLTYLPGDILWSIICNAANLTMPDQGLPPNAGQLRERAFWPRWELSEGGEIIGSREPDVCLEFENIHLLVEAKLRDDSQSQTSSQWAAEIAACLHRPDRDSSVPVGLLAIGGMGREPNPNKVSTDWKETQDLLANQFHYPNATVLLVACSWLNLLKALVKTMKNKDIELDISHQHIIFDLIDVLRFHGIRNTHWLTDLSQPDVLALRTVSDDSLGLLGTWARSTQIMTLAERNPWFIAPTLRGLDDQSINIFGRMINV